MRRVVSVSSGVRRGKARWRKISWLLFFPLPLVLAGCGVVAAFIPPIEIGDPLGVEGQRITASFAQATSSSIETQRIRPQAVSKAQTTVGKAFADSELDLRGFKIEAFHAAIGIDPGVTVFAPAPDAPFPSTFEITRLSVSADVEDDVHGSASMSVEKNVSLVFELDAESCSSGACYYWLADGDAFKDAFSITATDADGQTLSRFGLRRQWPDRCRD